eukprot:925187-Pelagomonas_calceolata.AAC.1
MQRAFCLYGAEDAENNAVRNTCFLILVAQTQASVKKTSKRDKTLFFCPKYQNKQSNCDGEGSSAPACALCSE